MPDPLAGNSVINQLNTSLKIDTRNKLDKKLEVAQR